MSREWMEDRRYQALVKHLARERRRVSEEHKYRPTERNKQLNQVDALAQGLTSLLQQVEEGYHTQLPLLDEVEPSKVVPKEGNNGGKVAKHQHLAPNLRTYT